MKSLLVGTGYNLCKVYTYHDSQAYGYKRYEILSRLDGWVMVYGVIFEVLFDLLCPFVDHTL
jgi:hypothetical protein